MAKQKKHPTNFKTNFIVSFFGKAKCLANKCPHTHTSNNYETVPDI